MKLLIVDDQSTVVQGLLHCTNWAAMGFTVVDTALNAVDAKASLLRQEAEVMLCDIEMPMESGLDLLDWLRQRGMTTRCIFLTAHAEFKYAQEALRLGGFDYIMQPAPYEQVADAVSRALDNVKEEWAALELQSRGAVFDDQKKEIVETMLRGFLLGNAPGSSLTAFEELSLVPRRERECWVALMQPLRWKQGEEPWELSLLSTAVGNMSSEVFTPLQVLSVTVAIPAEQCLVLVLQSRVGEPLEADYITRQLNYLQSACAQYIHCEAAFYPEGPQPFEQAPEIYQKLLQQRSENVALKGGVLLGRPAEKAPEVFRIPQIGAWQKLLQAGCAQAMEQEACQLLDKLTANNQLNSQTLRYFYQDFMQMLFSLPEKKRQDDMFREPEALELYRNGMKTVPDMKALVHYVASVWDSETEESSQSTVEIIMAYIAEHLLNAPEEKIRAMRGSVVSMIFQDPMSALNPVMTVGAQIMEVLKIHHPEQSTAQLEARVDEMMELVGIPAKRKVEYPHQFSGGMKQRIVIAIALACEPKLILADEPTTALDVTIQAQMLGLINELQKRLNTAMILITHDLGVVAQTCEKVMVMYAGEAIEYGTAEDIFETTQRHPYTQGLFNAIPKLDENTKRLEAIEGMMADPTQKIEGCRFADRCKYATAACKKAQKMREVTPGHFIRCCRFDPPQSNT